MEDQRQSMATEADARAAGIDEIAAQALATDWASLGALILGAAAIATAKHMVQDARCVALKGSVVEPPTRGSASPV